MVKNQSTPYCTREGVPYNTLKDCQQIECHPPIPLPQAVLPPPLPLLPPLPPSHPNAWSCQLVLPEMFIQIQIK